jgi:hypothetical protein
VAGRAATPQGRKLNNINNMPAKYKLFCTFCKVKLPNDWTNLPNCYVELSIENRLRGREYKIKKKPFKTYLKRHYLTNRTFSLWNGLSSDTVSVWTEYTNLKNT